MNFLAHIYLSGDHELIKIGNFMADGIRGKKYEEYQTQIKNGILLHRFIDSYTDSHSIFKQTTKKLHANYGHYSGVLADMIYDHFLAKNWKDHCEEDLFTYTENFYKSLQNNYTILTDKTKHLLPYMINGNWLYNYKELDKLDIILKQMDQRTKYLSKMSSGINDLLQYYSEFESEFNLFFKEIKTASKIKLIELIES